jgi:hypothetical protein
MKTLRARYAAAATKDAAVVVNLNIVIDAVAIPQNELAFSNRAISSRVRATLAALFLAAITEQENILSGLKTAAKAEYDALFGP